MPSGKSSCSHSCQPLGGGLELRSVPSLLGLELFFSFRSILLFSKSFQYSFLFYFFRAFTQHEELGDEVEADGIWTDVGLMDATIIRRRCPWVRQLQREYEAEFYRHFDIDILQQNFLPNSSTKYTVMTGRMEEWEDHLRMTSRTMLRH